LELILDILDRHPCFSQCGATASGRIHLPVAPRCNIFCQFCSRALSSDAERPGNATRVVSPDEALDIMEMALTLCPEIQVAGVAGPGEPLAGPEALDSLIMIKERYPQLIACLATNGLALAQSMDRLLQAGVKTLTVTVNALDPVILQAINLGVLEGGKFLGGLAGAERLIAAQREGIRLARENDLFVKINSVLVPGINDGEMEKIAKAAQGWGASVFNIIPLIPANNLADTPAPTPEELAAVVAAAEKYLPVKRDCRRCRADACGQPGGIDYSKALYGDLRPQETFSHG
jgi:nitrogen fixation protein NifB